MSFDRARIKRFNDEFSCAPPVTKYDPKIPHGSQGRDFASYSGRDPTQQGKEDGIFLTPAKPSRSRPLVVGSACTRSNSNSANRFRKGTRSTSTKSLNVLVLPDTPDDRNRTLSHDSLSGSVESVYTLDKYESLQEDVCTKNQKILELESDKVVLENIMVSTEQKVTELEASLSELEKQKETTEKDFSDRYDSLKEELCVKTQTILELEAEKAKLEATSSELNMLKEDTERDFSARYESLKEELFGKANAILNLESEKVVLQSKVASSEQKTAEVEASLSELNHQKDVAERDFSERHESLKGDLCKTHERISSLASENSTLENMLASGEQMIAGLKESLSELAREKEITEKDFSDRYDSLKEELYGKTQMLLELEAEKVTLEAAAVELNKLKQDTEKDFSDRYDSLKEELCGKTQTILELESEKVVLQSKVASSEQKTAEVEASLSELSHNKEVAEKDLLDRCDSLKEDLSKKTQALLELEAEKVKLEAASMELRKSKEEAEKDFSVRYESLMEELFGKTHNILNLESEKVVLQSMVASSEQKITEIEASLSELSHTKEVAERDFSDRYEGLKGDLCKNNERMSILESENSNLESMLATGEQKIAGLKESLSELAKQKEITEKDFSDRYDSLEEELCGKTQMLLELEAEKIKLEATSNELKMLKEDAEKDFSTRYEGLKDELFGRDHTILNLESEKVVLQSKVASSEQKITEVKASLSELSHKKEVAEREFLDRYESLKGDLGKNNERMSILESENSNLESMLASGEQKVAELKESLTELAKEKDVTEKDLVDRCDSLKKELSEKAQTIFELETEKVKLEATSVELNKLKEDAEKDFSARYERLMEDVLGKNITILNLESEKEDLQSKVESSEQKTAEVEASLSDLRHDKEVAERDFLDRYESLKEELSGKTQAILELEAEKKKLEATSSELSKQQEVAERDFSERYESLKEELYEKTQSILELESEKIALEGVLASTKQIVSELESSLSYRIKQQEDMKKDFSDRYESMEEELFGKNHMILNLESEKVVLQSTVAKSEQKTAEVEASLSDFRHQKEVAERDFSDRYESLKGDLCKTNQRMSSLESENSALESMLASREQKIAELKDSLSNQKEIMKKDLQTIQNLNLKYNDELEESTRNFKETYSTLQSEKVGIECKLKEFENEHLELTLNYDQLKQQHALVTSQRLLWENTAKSDAETIQSLSNKVEEYRMKELDVQRFYEDREMMEARLKELMLQNKRLKGDIAEYVNIYGDYASLVSHQNQKQKIHHVIKIKDENLKLRDENTQLCKKVAELREKLKHATTITGNNARRRFDPSQAFKPILKEPFIRDDATDIRGPESRTTFTVSKNPRPSSTVTIVGPSRREAPQGVAFDVTFTENKEN